LSTTAPRRVAVAFSGGLDSTALLHATVHAAARWGVQVVALHVHHGLSEHADAWLAHARAVCQRWARRGLPLQFAVTRLSQRPARGQSVEAWARAQRYDGLRRLALEHGATLVLLAHHRRDQAETFVLQALRGAAPAGLASMPAQIERAGLVWARPWLDQPHAAIEAYARRHRLQWVDDDSNTDRRFARNRLRHAVWPTLLAAFPDAEVTLAGAAAQAQQAQRCLDEVAEADLAATQRPQGLSLEAWKSLGPARRANVLTAWLREVMGRSPPATLVQRLTLQWPVTPAGRWPCPAGEVRSYRGLLRFMPLDRRAAEATDTSASRERTLPPLTQGRAKLPGWHGTLIVEAVEQGGLSPERLARLELRERRGGERFQSTAGGQPRSLRKQYQSAGVAAWLRDGPLLYDADCLVFVPGLGIDARACAPPGHDQVALRWVCDRAHAVAPVASAQTAAKSARVRKI
jgi:tRNA(Ile)-lysidine synthase